jgi:hypothetical protein
MTRQTAGAGVLIVTLTASTDDDELSPSHGLKAIACITPDDRREIPSPEYNVPYANVGVLPSVV